MSIVGEYFVKPGTNLTCAAVGSASCSVFCTGDDARNVCLWTAESKGPFRVLSGHSSEVTTVAFTRDDKYCVSGSQGGTVLVWDLESQKVALALKEHRVACTALGVPANETTQLLVTGSQDTNVKVWDLRTGNSVYTLKGHDGAVQSVCLSPGNDWVASGDDEGSIKVSPCLTGSRSGERRMPRYWPT